jgi:hypothetical protein
MEVVGVYRVAEAVEPCHLVEVLLDPPHAHWDWGNVTQEVPGQPRDNWQVPYDEQLVDEVSGRGRYVFFFHYLDLRRPLLTPAGPVLLPNPQPLPPRLQHIEYFAP